MNTAATPAGSLLAIATALDKRRGETKSAAVVWLQVFREVLADPGLSLAESVAMTLGLLDEAEHQLQALGPDGRIALEGLQPTRALVDGFFNIAGVPFKQFMGPLTDVGLFGLRTADDLLVRKHQSPELDEDAVDGFLRDISALIDEVGKLTDLTTAERSWILSRLEAVARALRHYHFAGFDTFESALNDLMLGLYQRPKLREQILKLSASPVVGNLFSATSLALGVASTLKLLGN